MRAQQGAESGDGRAPAVIDAQINASDFNVPHNSETTHTGTILQRVLIIGMVKRQQRIVGLAENSVATIRLVI